MSCRYDRSTQVTYSHYCPCCRKRIIYEVSKASLPEHEVRSSDITCNSSVCLDWYLVKCGQIKDSIIPLSCNSQMHYAMQHFSLSLYAEKI